jgi:hypothetical protein
MTAEGANRTGDRRKNEDCLTIITSYKGVGRIYQQTVIDTYAKVAFAMLKTTDSMKAAAWNW